MCNRFPLFTSHPLYQFSSNSVCTYLTFFWLTFFYLTTGPHVLICFCSHFPNFTSFSFCLPSPFPLCFLSWDYWYWLFKLDLCVWDFQPVKPSKDPKFLPICSLAIVNFTSAPSTQILISKIWTIKYLTLQQVQISKHFIPASHNDLLISEPSDRSVLVYLKFIAILIATTSSWYPDRDITHIDIPPFLFPDY